MAKKKPQKHRALVAIIILLLALIGYQPFTVLPFGWETVFISITLIVGLGLGAYMLIKVYDGK